jgi:hypothetical protein
MQMVLDLNQRQKTLEDQQSPNVLAMISHVNNLKNDHENLVKSIPVTLRELTRSMHDIDRRLTEAQAQFANMSQPLEQRLAQTEDRLQAIEHLRKRMEFIRSELMFELRYGGSSEKGNTDGTETRAEILSPEKLEAARAENLRVNLGCGHIPLDGYINIDRRALPGVDIVAEAGNLPLNAGEADEVFSAHLLEHFPQEQLRRELLPYWVGLLKPGGTFRAVVPDADSMIKEYSNGTYPYEYLREVTFGAQDYDGDFHYNMFIPEQLKELTTEAGLCGFEVVDRGRRNGNCFEMEIKAQKA